MHLHLVLRHRHAPVQTWSNNWLDDDRIESIVTTAAIGDLCRAAAQRGHEVYVHRTGGGEPLVCCAAKVSSVDALPGGQAFVRFALPRRLHLTPTVKPHEGQNFYEALAP